MLWYRGAQDGRKSRQKRGFCPNDSGQGTSTADAVAECAHHLQVVAESNTIACAPRGFPEGHAQQVYDLRLNGNIQRRTRVQSHTINNLEIVGSSRGDVRSAPPGGGGGGPK